MIFIGKCWPLAARKAETMSYKNLLVEKDGPVAVVTLNRPEKLNALSQQFMEEIIRLCSDFHRDTETRVVIFQGAGKHFSAGVDLIDAVGQGWQTMSQFEKLRGLSLGGRMITSLWEMDQITIASLHGVALGGGACMATALDFRVGGADCRMGYPEINLAMNLSWKALPIITHLAGPARAKRMVILGEHVDAKTLHRWGLLDELVDEGIRPLDKAREMALEYAAKPPMAAQMIKKSVNHLVSALDQAVMHMDSDQFLLAAGTEDHMEGVSAFLEKREPVFKGQ